MHFTDIGRARQKRARLELPEHKGMARMLGDTGPDLFESRGIKSVAATGFKAPGVVVSYTEDPGVQSSKKFLAQGLQTAAGVPLQCDEPADFSTFRVGLFGLDKLHNIDRTVKNLERALDQVMPVEQAKALSPA